MEKVFELANKFVAQLNQTTPLPVGYQWSYAVPPESWLAYWYFEFEIKAIISITHQLQLGGAPGFVISKLDSQVRTISWAEKQAFEARQAQRIKINDSLLTTTPWTLQYLKQFINLPLGQLLNFKKKYQDLDCSKLSNRLIIIEAIEQLIN